MALACTPADRPPALVIDHVNVVDVQSGSVLRDRTVVIPGSRIATVDTAPKVTTADARVVDGRGKYLMPGLWDMHAHVDDGAPWIFPASIALGVTGMRDLGSRLEQLREWKQPAALAHLFPAWWRPDRSSWGAPPIRTRAW